MTWGDIKSLLSIAMSDYSTNRCEKLRVAKYSDGDHWKDGYLSMIYETLIEISPIDDMYPFDTTKTRRLIMTFNNLTSKSVENVWTT